MVPNTANNGPGGGIECEQCSPEIRSKLLGIQTSGLFEGGSIGAYAETSGGARSLIENNVIFENACARGLRGEPRVQGSVVDIGADEIGDAPPAFVPTISHVTADGDDLNNGQSWQASLRTLQTATDLAASSEGEVWVREGVCAADSLALRPFGRLYGGFGGTEAKGTERDWVVHKTIRHAASNRVAVRATSTAPWTTLDGFTIQNGQLGLAGGLVLSNKLVALNTGAGAGGICISGGQAKLLNNLVISNAYARSPGEPPEGTARGVLVRWASGMTLAEDVIAHNVNTNTVQTNGVNRGITCASANGRIANNTIVHNTAARDAGSGGFFIANPGTNLWIVNNLVVSNSSGVAAGQLGGDGVVIFG